MLGLELPQSTRKSNNRKVPDMADPTTPAPAAPAASPAPTQNAQNPAPGGASSAPKAIQRGASTIVNPTPTVDPDARPAEKHPDALPQATIDEMAAGKKALERNKPVATALEESRAAKSAGTVTTPETNPVDATNTLHQQGKV